MEIGIIEEKEGWGGEAETISGVREEKAIIIKT